MSRMRSYAKRWRARRAIVRHELAIERAIEAARAPTVEAELRAVAATQFNR
jgi:hypothetical protein